MLCPKDNITIAVIHGAKPGKTVGLRFDTDALQLQELCDVPYKSEHGRSDARLRPRRAYHLRRVSSPACSKRTPTRFAAPIRSSSSPPRRANTARTRSLQPGLVSDVDAFFGLHVWSLYPTGTLHATPGGIWAEPDMFKVTIHGKGGHGATPERSAWTRSPRARRSCSPCKPSSPASLSPMDSVVVTVGSFHAGTRCNIIAQDAVLEGTLRAFDDDVHAPPASSISGASSPT